MRPLLFSLVLFLGLSSVATAQGNPRFELAPLVQSIREQTQVPAVSTNQEDTSKVLKKIEIRGNKRVSTEQIRQELSLRLEQEVTDIDIRHNLRQLQSLGAFANIDYRLEDYDGGQLLIITVKEHPKITQVELNGMTVYEMDELLSELLSKEGDLLNLSNLRKDIQFLEAKYEEDGYFLAKVYQVQPPQADGPLVISISEGVLGEVEVTGNTRTQEYVITRELDSEPGQVLNMNVVRKDMMKLFNLNYFASVIPDFKPRSDAQGYDMKVAVEEKSTGSMNFGGGFSQAYGMFLYSDLNIDNIFGSGQLVALKGQWGTENSDYYQFKYHNPWMWNDRKSLTLRLWLTNGSYAYSSYVSYTDQSRKGVELSIGWPFSYEWTTRHSGKFETVKVTDEKEYYRIYSYTFSVIHDSRDVRFNPLNGFYHIVSVERGLPMDKFALDFTKYDVTLQGFFQTSEHQTIALRGIFGMMTGLVEDTELYYIGGGNTVRGYPEYPDSFAHGTKRAIVNAEYRFILNEMFQALLFADWGWANSLDGLDSGKIGKGAGLRINTPIGPIRLDYGFDEDNLGRFHFNIGHVF